MLKLRVSAVLLFGLAAQGCSLERAGEHGLSVALRPSSAPTEDRFSLLSTNWAHVLSTPLTNASQLSCFLVNVRGPATGSLPACGGNIQAGVTDGFRSGIDAVFSPVVPVSDGLTFEAYGTTGTCSDSGGSIGAPAGATLYRLGAVNPSVADLSKTVSIPVSLSNAQTYGCATTPYSLFTDSFNYTAGLLSTTSSGIWASGSAPLTDFSASGATTLTLGLAVNGNFVSSAAAPVDYSKPYYSVSIDFKITSVLAGISSNYLLGVGLSDSTSTTGASVGCYFFAPCSGSTCGGFKVMGGPTSGGLFNSSAGTAATYAVGNTATLKCEIRKQPGGQVKVTASGFNVTQGVALAATPDTNTAADPCSANGCRNPFIASNTSGNVFTTVTATATNFSLSTADVAQ